MENHPWETDIAELLTELSAAQDELFSLLGDKRRLLVAADTEGLGAIAPREEQLVSRLQACLARRADLLEKAQSQSLPADSIRSLAKAMPPGAREPLSARVAEAASRSRLLAHQALTHWVLTQRTLLHLSQLLEIIATGGRVRPTYGKGEPAPTSGSLVDQAA